MSKDDLMSAEYLTRRRWGVKGSKQIRCYVGDVVKGHGCLSTHGRIQVVERPDQSRQGRALIGEAIIVRGRALSAAERVHYFDAAALIRVGKSVGQCRDGRTADSTKSINGAESDHRLLIVFHQSLEDRDGGNSIRVENYEADLRNLRSRGGFPENQGTTVNDFALIQRFAGDRPGSEAEHKSPRGWELVANPFQEEWQGVCANGADRQFRLTSSVPWPFPRPAHRQPVGKLAAVVVWLRFLGWGAEREDTDERGDNQGQGYDHGLTPSSAHVTRMEVL